MSESGEQDESQKTEEPTQKRLEESRKKGQVPLSKEVNNWLMLFAATLVVVTISGGVMFDMSALMQTYIGQAHALPRAPGGLGNILGDAFIDILAILTLPLIVLMFAAFMGPFAQVGPMLAPESMKPDLSKISLIKGTQRLFSMRSLMEFAKGILKLGIIAVVGFLILMPYYRDVESLVGLPLPLMLEKINLLIIQLMSGVLVVMLVVAVADLLFQRYEHYKKMRMTKQEVKDEYKQMEGDPHVKGRLRQLRQERARQRMMQAVPEADVVITNPTHFSVALKYDPDNMAAPKVVAKGVDELALRIREVATENKVVLYENPPLARSLYDTVEVDDFIPAELYKAVAEVISFVFKKTGRI